MNTSPRPARWEGIAGTDDSYVLRDWLPGAEADSLLGMITREVALGFTFQHAAYVEATCDTKDPLPSSDEIDDDLEEEEEEEEESDDVDSLISDNYFWIPQLAVTPTPCARAVKSLLVWNHVDTSSDVVAQTLGRVVRHVNKTLDDIAEGKGQRYVQIRGSESRSNYVSVRHLVDLQRIDMRHMDPEAGNCEGPVCLLALGGERTLCLQVWNPYLEPADEIRLTPGCLVVLTPSLVTNGFSYAVRPLKGCGRRRGGCVTHAQHTPHVLVEIRAVESLCRANASIMHVA